jgi:Co/Zn/Cd efflux system component
VCTFVFSLLVLYTTTQLIQQSVGVLMEGVPEGINPDEVEASLRRVAGVQGM